MKILHINRNYLGTNLHQTMLRNLAKRGIDGNVFVPTNDKSIGVVTPDENVVVDECFGNIDRFVFDLKQHKIIKSAVGHFDVGGFDVIHAYTVFTDGNCARKLSKKYGVPYVVAVRNTDVNDFFAKQPYLIKRGVSILSDASAVFFLSEKYKENVFEKYIPKELRESIGKKSYVIPNGIDDFWYEHKLTDAIPERLENIRNKKPRLLYAGRVDGNKNIGMIQKAVDILNAEGYDAGLTVVGRVMDEKIFEEIRKHPRTTYLPPVKKEDLIGIYRENDIFIMPSKFETFGLVYAEALTQGLPIIYTLGQGFDGQFGEGEVGFHVDPTNVESIVAAIKGIMTDYDAISRNISETSDRFAWDSIIDKYVSIYNALNIGGKR